MCKNIYNIYKPLSYCIMLLITIWKRRLQFPHSIGDRLFRLASELRYISHDRRRFFLRYKMAVARDKTSRQINESKTKDGRDARIICSNTVLTFAPVLFARAGVPVPFLFPFSSFIAQRDVQTNIRAQRNRTEAWIDLSNWLAKLKRCENCDIEKRHSNVRHDRRRLVVNHVFWTSYADIIKSVQLPVLLFLHAYHHSLSLPLLADTRTWTRSFGLRFALRRQYRHEEIRFNPSHLLHKYLRAI